MHLAQEYLKTHTLDQLKAEHGINYRVANHKVSLNYDMLEAKNDDRVSQQCRGTILSTADGSAINVAFPLGDTVILSRPMDRFFNQGQGEAHDIDFSAQGVKFYEKHDGTMCALYYDPFKEEWCVSTRSIPEADLPIDAFEGYTFRTLFDEAFEKSVGKSVPMWAERCAVQNCTYIFELCTPLNRIVVDHGDFKVVLLAIRDSGHGHEIDVSQLAEDTIPKSVVCETYDLSSLHDMVKFVSERDPMSHEGIVVCDESFRRVKVKSPGYLALSRIKDSAVSSPRALLQLILLGKIDDALPVLPEYMVEKAEKMQENLAGYLKKIDVDYGILVDTVDLSSDNLRKEVALYTQAHMTDEMGYVMKRYFGTVKSYRDYMDSMVDKNTGEYSKSFLEGLLVKIK